MDTPVVFSSSLIDALILYGIGAEGLGQALYGKENVELRYCNGLFAFWVDGVEVWRGGTSSLEPTADDWRRVATKGMSL